MQKKAQHFQEMMHHCAPFFQDPEARWIAEGVKVETMKSVFRIPNDDGFGMVKNY